MVDEPVRGRLPDPSFYSLAGIDRLRALMDRFVPMIPVSHLTCATCTHAEPGSMVGLLPALTWFQRGDGTVDTRFFGTMGLDTLALTLAAPGMNARVVSVSFQDFRPCALKSKTLSVTSRLVNASKASSVGEGSVDDGFGRALCRVSGRFVFDAVDPPPPPSRPLSRCEDPSYATPDPYRRPLGSEQFPSLEAIHDAGGWLAAFAQMVDGSLPHPPVCQLMGIKLTAVSAGFASATMTANDWLLVFSPNTVSPVYLASFAHLTMSSSAATLVAPGHALRTLEESHSFVRAAPCDGENLLVRARVVHQGDFLISTAEVTDTAGNQVALGSQTAMCVSRRRDDAAADQERILGTVLFTDLVGSTEQADRLGDAGWRRLLEEHHEVVRAQLQAFKGREVKTTGDGFLAVFDGPTRAVQCARAIRDALSRLGLEIRAGLHTGEYEAVGTDIAGVAVHVASRVQALAAPGEILVSGTVHDLVAGSGLTFADRGRHRLKGLDGDWAVFSVQG